MQTDDDLQTTLSKWPFILGDVLLVGTALAIAILGDWKLTNWQVASCVISVALGAGLYVLPYIVEYQVRVREETEDRSAELRILRRQFAHAEAELETVNERIESIDLNLKEFAGRLDERNHPPPPDLSGPLEALEAKLTPLLEAGSAQQAELQTLRERISELSESIHSQPDAEGFEPQATELEVDHKASVSRPMRAPRKRRSVEPRLLQKAIGQKQDSAAAAVSRIIGGKSKEAVAPLDSGKTPDLFAETVPPQPDKPKRTRKQDTAVIASVFIGIGNKPYLRGSGAGLNWDQGVAMEFEEIGKWRWVAPAEFEEAVELQVYRNDEDADQNGKHILEPEQQLEISPMF